MAGGLAVFATGAGAAPQPTVSQVQAKINKLTSQFDKVNEQLDQASQQLSAVASWAGPQRQAGQGTGWGGGGTGTTSPPYGGPTSPRGGRAGAFAYPQRDKPYQWGATGPGSYDCSGLVQAAWASAGVNIPRTPYAQWAALPHISTSALGPGDLLYLDGVGHVALYVGGVDLLDAPPTWKAEQIIISPV